MTMLSNAPPLLQRYRALCMLQKYCDFLTLKRYSPSQEWVLNNECVEISISETISSTKMTIFDVQRIFLKKDHTEFLANYLAKHDKQPGSLMKTLRETPGSLKRLEKLIGESVLVKLWKAHHEKLLNWNCKI